MHDRFFKLLRADTYLQPCQIWKKALNQGTSLPETYMAHTHWVRPVHDTITDQKYTKNGTEPTLSQHDEAAITNKLIPCFRIAEENPTHIKSRTMHSKKPRNRPE